jgi:hypothetical protein
VDREDQIHSSAGEDAAVESAVLQCVLALHPVQINFDELLRELDGDSEDFARRDAIERAVRDLGGAGLLQRNGPFVLPTRAALRFDELLAD